MRLFQYYNFVKNCRHHCHNRIKLANKKSAEGLVYTENTEKAKQNKRKRDAESAKTTK